jgi:TIR domain
MNIFISHSSQNQNYGNELVNLLTAVGLKDEEIIFTSNDAYGIPIGQSIFDWLKNRISEKPHVLYLLSPEYYKSVACLNEMGAAWVVESKHTMIFTPEFNLTSPEFLNGAINPREIGFFIHNHDKLIAFIELLRTDFSISSNPVLIGQKVRLFLENIKSFKPIVISIPDLPPVLSNAVSFKDQEFEIPEQIIEVKPIVDRTQLQSGKSRLMIDLESNKLKDEDVLLIHYIIETGRFKLGTGWRSKPEIENIKVWEEVQELNHSLSTNYEDALRRFEMKNITEVSETTGYGNPRELSIKEDVKKELLNMTDELLSKIDKVFQKNKKTPSNDIIEDLPF